MPLIRGQKSQPVRSYLKNRPKDIFEIASKTALYLILIIVLIPVLIACSDNQEQDDATAPAAVMPESFTFFDLGINSRLNKKFRQELGNKLVGAVDALFLTESVAVAKQTKEILASAKAGKCIVFSQIPDLVEAGALIGLEADLEEQGKLVAVHALQALQGQKVHILPVREAKKVSLKINNQTAAQLGLTIPPEVASKAKLM